MYETRLVLNKCRAIKSSPLRILTSLCVQRKMSAKMYHVIGWRDRPTTGVVSSLRSRLLVSPFAQPRQRRLLPLMKRYFSIFSITPKSIWATTSSTTLKMPFDEWQISWMLCVKRLELTSQSSHDRSWEYTMWILPPLIIWVLRNKGKSKRYNQKAKNRFNRKRKERKRIKGKMRYNTAQKTRHRPVKRTTDRWANHFTLPGFKIYP